MFESEYYEAMHNHSISDSHQQSTTSMEEVPLWLLVELANELSTTTNLAALQGILSRKLRWLFNFDCCTLAVHSKRSDTEYVLFDITSPSQIKSTSVQKISLDQGWSGVAIATSKPYFLTDLNQLPSSVTAPINPYIGITPQACSLMLLPLKLGERTIGSLNFSSNTPNAYSINWRNLAILLAVQVAGQLGSILAQEQTISTLKALAVSQAKLKSAYEFQQRVMESAANAIYALDLEGKFTLVNQQTAEITGYSVTALIGCPFLELFSPTEAIAIQKQLSAIISRGVSVYHHVAELIKQDGTQQLIKFSLSPIFIDGDISAVVGTAQSARQ